MASKVTSMLYTAVQAFHRVAEEDNKRLQEDCAKQCRKALEAKTVRSFEICMRLCEAHKALEQTPK